MKEFELEALSEYDGKDEKPVYIVHQGRVFDVTQSKLWKGGVHMKRHHAGRDLTTDFGGAPHGTEVFERYPQVGIIKKEEAPERSMPEMLTLLLHRFPMLRRHPHPMTVHFPIAFMLSATMFTFLYLITGIASFETTALHCLGGWRAFCARGHRHGALYLVVELYGQAHNSDKDQDHGLSLCCSLRH